MLKKLLVTIILIFFLISLAIWSPWEQYNLTIAKFFGVEEIEKFAGIELYSLNGELELYIGNELKGNINPEGGYLTIGEITPGAHIVKVKRKIEPEGAYHEITKSINFVENLNTIIAYELGPTEEFSQGHIFYARKQESVTNSNIANLNIRTNKVEGVEIHLDDTSIGNTPLTNFALNLDKSYILKLNKEGFEDLTFNILPENEEDRLKLQGLDLFIEADLFWIPLDIEKEEN